MQKWEYMTMDIRNWIPLTVTINDKLLEKPPKFEELLNWLGDDGWEIISASSAEGGFWEAFILKRPK